MKTVKPKYDPDNAADVSEFMRLLSELYARGRAGADEAILHITEVAATPEGRRLLFNCHRVASAQLPTVAHPVAYGLLKWIQKTTGMFARGGK